MVNILDEVMGPDIVHSFSNGIWVIGAVLLIIVIILALIAALVIAIVLITKKNKRKKEKMSMEMYEKKEGNL